jgi:FtsP/CotA-like multicopper oxidase with cupredoxin domain
MITQDALTETTPWFPITPDLAPPTTQNIDIEFGQNATGFWVWTMNGESFRGNYNEPILLLSNLGNNSYPDSPQWNVYNFGSNSSVRIHITNPGFLAHPIHLHGHNMFVLDVGIGSWDGSTVINPSNPQRRDVQLVPAGGYLVLQLTADNPGAWPLHCHIAWHVSAGLYITVLERPDDIAKLQIPSVMAQTCRDWAAFTNKTVVDQIDSGL